jgi:hypothetical protein
MQHDFVDQAAPPRARAAVRSVDSQRSAARIELECWRARLSFDDLPRAPTAYAPGAARSYLRLPACVGCEAWLISWPPDSCSPLHDHGGARGFASVLHGELRECVRLAQPALERSNQSTRNSSANRWLERAWQTGGVIEIASDACHEVWNASTQTVYSLHVYEPKLASMTFYERTAAGGVRALRDERAEQW